MVRTKRPRWVIQRFDMGEVLETLRAEKPRKNGVFSTPAQSRLNTNDCKFVDWITESLKSVFKQQKGAKLKIGERLTTRSIYMHRFNVEFLRKRLGNATWKACALKRTKRLELNEIAIDTDRLVTRGL